MPTVQCGNESSEWMNIWFHQPSPAYTMRMLTLPLPRFSKIPYTPLKINIEHAPRLIKKKSHLPNLHFRLDMLDMLVFQGVTKGGGWVHQNHNHWGSSPSLAILRPHVTQQDNLDVTWRRKFMTKLDVCWFLWTYVNSNVDLNADINKYIHIYIYHMLICMLICNK